MEEERVPRKVKFLVCMAGHAHVWNVGDVAEVEGREADSLIAAGFAAAVEDDPEGEGKKNPMRRKKVAEPKE